MIMDIEQCPECGHTGYVVTIGHGYGCERCGHRWNPPTVTKFRCDCRTLNDPATLPDTCLLCGSKFEPVFNAGEQLP